MLSARKSELIVQLHEYVLAHGISDSSLRAAAAAVGTNARMLIYHFGSREQMVVELLDHARVDQETLLRSSIQELGQGQLAEKLLRIWHTLSSKRFEGHARLFFESFGRGIQGRSEFAVVLKGNVTFLADLVESVLTGEGVVRSKAKVSAQMIAAGFRGLVIDLLATGDRSRANAAAYQMIEAATQAR